MALADYTIPSSRSISTRTVDAFAEDGLTVSRLSKPGSYYTCIAIMRHGQEIDRTCDAMSWLRGYRVARQTTSEILAALKSANRNCWQCMPDEPDEAVCDNCRALRAAIAKAEQ